MILAGTVFNLVSLYNIYIYVYKLIILGDRKKFYQRDLDLGRAKIKVK